MHYCFKQGIIHNSLNAQCKEAIQCEAECGSFSVRYCNASLSALFNPLTHVTEWIILLTPWTLGQKPKRSIIFVILGSEGYLFRDCIVIYITAMHTPLSVLIIGLS